MRAGLLVLAVAASSCKSDGKPKSQPAETEVSTPAPGCGDDYAELVSWADELKLFKEGYDLKYRDGGRPPPAGDLVLDLTADGIAIAGADRAPWTALDDAATADAARAKVGPAPKVARIAVADPVTWKQMVEVIGFAHRLGFAQVGFVVHDRAQVPRRPPTSPIHARLVEIADKDDKPIEDKDGALLAEVFARCAPVVDGLASIRGKGPIDRYKAFVTLVVRGLAKCECRADLPSVSELVWARARLSPFVDRLLVFTLGDGADARKVEFAAAAAYREIRTPLAQLAADLGEKPTPIAFSVAR